MNWQQMQVLLVVMANTTGSDPLLAKIHQAARAELEQLAAEEPAEEEEE